jgi:hypothetical protein
MNQQAIDFMMWFDCSLRLFWINCFYYFVAHLIIVKLNLIILSTALLFLWDCWKYHFRSIYQIRSKYFHNLLNFFIRSVWIWRGHRMLIGLVDPLTVLLFSPNLVYFDKLHRSNLICDPQFQLKYSCFFLNSTHLRIIYKHARLKLYEESFSYLLQLSDLIGKLFPKHNLIKPRVLNLSKWSVYLWHKFTYSESFLHLNNPVLFHVYNHSHQWFKG